MANALFAKAREGFLRGEIDWVGDTFRVALCRSKPNPEKDEFLASLSVIATSEPLEQKTCEGGVADAKDIRFGKVKTEEAACLVIYQDKGKGRLVALIDTVGTARFPRVLSGGEVDVVWSNGPKRIFAL